MGKPKKKVSPKITCSVNRNMDELAMKEIVKAVKDVNVCWENVDKRGCPHHPVVVTVCCVLKVMMNRTYDSIEAYVKNNKLLKGLFKEHLDGKGMPGHSVIYRGMQKLTRNYIKKLNKRITIRFRRKRITVIVDSTGFSLSTSSKYFDIRIGRKNSRKNNAKLHLLVCASTGIVPEFRITNWEGKGTGDGPQFRKMLKVLQEIERAIGDGTYSSRASCNAVAEKKGQAIFHVRSDATTKAKNSPEWKKMVTLFKENPELYETIYHIRSFIEAVISSIKKRWGSFLKSKKKRMQKKELALKTLSYNVKQVLYNKRAEKLRISLWEECK